jgi:hypothetical protein
MIELRFKFDSIDDPVDILFESNTNADFFCNFLKSFNRPADRIYYQLTTKETIDKFLNHANKAKVLFGFDWDLDNLCQENYNLWHRDIETFDLSQHPPWSQEKGDFFIDLHQSLHNAEPCNLSSSTVRNRVQIKWFADSVPWPETPQFIAPHELESGDIVTDFPHVGKSPWVSCMNNDIENLSQSCRLPDACPPGFLILLQKSSNRQSTDMQKKKLVEWYYKNSNQLNSMFSIDEMLTYFGEYRIGKLKHVDQIPLLQTRTLSSVIIV